MCSPKIPEQKQQLPSAPPPPPEETAKDFSTVKEEDAKSSTAKKRKGTAALKLSDRSPLSIPGADSSVNKTSGGLFIP